MTKEILEKIEEHTKDTAKEAEKIKGWGQTVSTQYYVLASRRNEIAEQVLANQKSSNERQHQDLEKICSYLRFLPGISIQLVGIVGLLATLIWRLSGT